ncbi:AfsR/SARP family transcriptional regulator [Nocardia cyriacigeorgica]|uniref:AfsR/SARP family transcriptional regulator n=1 Tax=Nocardia cyriacigeorgica TaxID=135487 RepID=A0A6P1D5Y2_9NOCA|nr:AfsR/SARP family transcriptional regulator [Nocardia cyriacigeorgica]NEW43602.1 AfsR/SARP family transcriptional regulator [Nocardia cyriacigeorgica]
MTVSFGVLGPVLAWDAEGGRVELKGPRHRAVLARLIVARGRVVPVEVIVDDLWEHPADGAKAAVRTFVAALRRALEPERPARTAARLLVTEGSGYALRADRDTVDAWRFEQVLRDAADLAPARALESLSAALGWWRGPAYADFSDMAWARAESARLEELRLMATERQAQARLTLGRAADAVPDLDAMVSTHPWREEGWRLLALALYRSGRQGDALAVLRRARGILVDELGLDPGPRLAATESGILRRDTGFDDAADRMWAEATAAYDRTVAGGATARLESTVGLLHSLAMTGSEGLAAARAQRLDTVTAAEQHDDPQLTARIIGSYDVPAIWTRSDDPAQAAQIVAAAERTIARLTEDASAGLSARLLTTIAIESRGIRTGRGYEAARAATGLARALDDPALLAFALNGLFLQTCHRTGLAHERDEIGRELVELSRRHDLVPFEILGHLVRMQARSAFGDAGAADAHAETADRLGARHERPLVAVFTEWYRAMRAAATGATIEQAESGYRTVAQRFRDCGMPGFERGVLPLALLCLRVWHGAPADFAADTEWGPYEPWARPLLLIAEGRREEAAEALRRAPEPPPDLLLEALWCLIARAAIALGNQATMTRARVRLAPAAGEIAGAGSGILTAGPVDEYLAELDNALSQR